MTFQQLTYAVEVARCSSINKAAEHLYTHQSNVSNIIRQLEDELGIQIFTRTQKGVILTDAGREFLSYAQELVKKKNFLEQMYTVRNQHQPVHFTVSSMRSYFAYAPLIEMARDQQLLSGSVNLRLRKCSLKDVLEDVANNADLGFVFTMNPRTSRLFQLARMKALSCTPLGESRLHVILREGHPLLKEPDLSRICDYPYVIIENQENFSLLYDEESDSLSSLFSTVPEKIISTNDSMTCQDIVSKTDAFFISTTPWKHQEHYRFASIPLPGDENKLTFYGVLRQNTEPNSFVSFYLDFLRRMLIPD